MEGRCGTTDTWVAGEGTKLRGIKWPAKHLPAVMVQLLCTTLPRVWKGHFNLSHIKVLIQGLQVCLFQ